jgi:hypothetical protein
VGLQGRVAFILVLVTVTLGGAASAQGQRPTGHRLTVRQRTCVPGECICTGRADARGRLSETGPTANELRRGSRCIAADFDGNGAVDYALPGGEGFVTVILSRPGGGFLRAVRLDAGGMIYLYAPRSAAGREGEPPAKLHGLYVPSVGQGDAVFLWDGDGFARTVFRARAGER